ncbi:hypothetical protein SFA35_07305 [Pseudomonas sp. HR96]|uniref:hypothetical protein n=1 Tax=Pseudomonas sp. HR96 TaxID=1027966 RepID=UPI002A75568C|nr:hypothetical protein [Pseudomonas sp. HR96]WPP01157.1 hypothetical protein SFA35_07305 [Pseudomonas sp. HR96]
MKYHSLPLQPMQESGAYLLRALQNEETPLLDLLVRESVQNALDAGCKGKPALPVSVDFYIRDHSVNAIASTFGEGLNQQVFATRFPRAQKLLEIRDSGTEGLTGPMTFEGVEPHGQHGNFLKLVFEIGRTRSDEGAGGSWGLGKTCYFRMGAGLVIYYSRIRVGEEYEERLVASIVEDENRVDRLQLNTQTGIAWWGAEGGLGAITSPSHIHEILDAFDAKPFTGKQTGTAIIIPLLKEKLLPVFDGERGATPWWYGDYESYIAVSIQRWFSARLDNPFFATGRYLKASVNGKELAHFEMLPIFQVAQSLYNRAMSDTAKEDYLTGKGIKSDHLLSKSIQLRGEFVGSGLAGRLLAVALTPRQLQMDAPDNAPSPETCIFSRADCGAPHRPVVTFMRSPGMNISWDDSLDSRSWAGGFAGFPDGRYVVALFLPDSEQELQASEARGLRSTIQTLEGYLRSCERADHGAWVDISGGRVIEKIRAQCGRAIKDFGSPPTPSLKVKPSMRMSRKLAELVLPNRGFGGDGRFGKAAPRAAATHISKGAAVPSPELEITELGYEDDAIVMKWRLSWGMLHQGMPRDICVSVDSEGGPITFDTWVTNRLGAFPFHLDSFKLSGSAITVGSVGIDGGTGVRLTLTGPAIESGLIFEGKLHVRMSDSDRKLLRPVIGVRISDGGGAAK